MRIAVPRYLPRSLQLQLNCPIEEVVLLAALIADGAISAANTALLLWS